MAPRGDVVAETQGALNEMGDADADADADADTDADAKSSKSEGLKKHSREVPLVELKLQNISYSPVAAIGGKKSDKKRIAVLKNVSTTISPYKLTAIMGPSGSGKTRYVVSR
jgi:ABC-type multidrug transport system fused ATPase/permease subunit